MWSPRKGSRPEVRHGRGRGHAVWAALALGWMLPSTGCQVEYAGMTLPSGKYMHDDVQYFPGGPDFPWANTQAATQRARMQALGMDVAAPGQGGPLTVTPGQGALQPVQNQMGRPTDVNQSPLSVEPRMPDERGGAPGAGGVPAPGGGVPAPGAGGNAPGEAAGPPGTPGNP